MKDTIISLGQPLSHQGSTSLLQCAPPSLSFVWLFLLSSPQSPLVGVDGARDEKLPPILHETSEEDSGLGL